MVGYTDSDHGGHPMERKSTYGYIFLLNNAPIAWCSKKQPVVVLFSCEAEYITESFAACQGVWLEELLKELMVPIKTSTTAKNIQYFYHKFVQEPNDSRRKHIKVKYHFLRELVNKGSTVLIYDKTEEQIADIFTKAWKIESFDLLKKRIDVISLSSVFSLLHVPSLLIVEIYVIDAKNTFLHSRLDL